MSFQVALLVFGTLLLLLGLVGRIKAREFEVGASNPVVRGIAVALGAGFIAAAFLANPEHGSIETSADSPSPDSDARIVLIPLNLYFSPERQDYFTAATSTGIHSAGEARYAFKRVEGCILASADPSRPSVPLWLYYHDEWEDNFTGARPESEQAAFGSGYRAVREEGFVYSVRYPDTVPLKLYKASAGKDHLTTGNRQSENEARSSNYVYLRDEAYIYPKDRCT